jgi:hypothetical protein
MRTLFYKYGADYQYSQQVCYTLCQQAFIYSECNCTDSNFWNYNNIFVDNEVINAKLCPNPSSCVQQARNRFNHNPSVQEQYCSHCLQECTIVNYNIVSSSLKWVHRKIENAYANSRINFYFLEHRQSGIIRWLNNRSSKNSKMSQCRQIGRRIIKCISIRIMLPYKWSSQRTVRRITNKNLVSSNFRFLNKMFIYLFIISLFYLRWNNWSIDLRPRRTGSFVSRVFPKASSFNQIEQIIFHEEKYSKTITAAEEFFSLQINDNIVRSD